MPAEIEILCPALSFRKRIWIERPVSRIGSDPGCEMFVPISELDAHAFTLIYESGGYKIISASAEGATLNGKAIGNQETFDFQDSDTIECANNISIQIAIQGDPAPSRPPLENDDDEFPTYDEHVTEESREITSNQSSEKSAKNALTIIVIIACFAGVGLMLFPDLLAGSGSKLSNGEQTIPKFEEILELDLISDNLKERVRFAYIAYCRKDGPESKKLFTFVRGSLKDSPLYDEFSENSKEGESKEVEQLRKVFLFVRFHLRKLK